MLLAIFVRFDDPALAVACNALQYAEVQPAALILSAMISQDFIGGMMPELANTVQQSLTIIEIRPF